MSKYEWVPGEKITSARLNQLEDNIANAKSDLFKTVPMVDGGALETVKLTPHQLSEYDAAGTIISCYHPDRDITPFSPGVVRRDYSNSSSNSHYVSTLSRGFVEITEDSASQIIPLYGDRYHWIVTVTHNSDTQVLSNDEISDHYYGQVGGTHCEVYEEYSNELGRPTVQFYISENSSDDFSVGDFTVTVTQSDVTKVVAPQQTVTFEDEGSSEYDISLETSTGYVLSYSNVYPSSKCFVEGTEVYSGSSYDQEDPFTGVNYHISSNQNGSFELLVRDDNSNPAPGRYYVVVKYVYSSNPAEGAPDPEGKYSYLTVVESKDIDYGILVSSDGYNYNYTANDEDQNYSCYWD